MLSSRLVVAATLLSVGGSLEATVPTRSVVLVTIDTMRADYLGCNGAEGVATPHLDRIASEGVNFTRARAHVPLTLPSHASILTGNYPPTHSVRDNGAFRLADSEITLTEVLGSYGYRTLAVVGSFVLDKRFGLGQGFEIYDDRVWSDVSEVESLRAERTAGEVFEAFRSWLQVVEAKQRFFAWIHLYDPHAPYLPPEPYRSRYPDDPYAGEIAYVDSVVGEILEELTSSDRLDRTIVAVVGDHGEGLGEHGEVTHSLLIHNSTLHVPMMIRAPGLIPGSRIVNRMVRTIDLAPTLLVLLGIEAPFGEGVSLAPLVSTGETVAEFDELSSYGESLYGELNLGWAPLYSLEKGQYRLILGAEPELYDIAADPRETRNRMADDSAVFDRMRDDLSGYLTVEVSEASPPGPDADTTEVEEKLRSLGYLAGSSRSARSDGVSGQIDPKAKLGVWNEIQVGIELYAKQEYGEAARVFEGVVRDEPGVVLAYEFLGSSLYNLGRLEAARNVFAKALAHGLESARIQLDLGKTYMQTGDSARAIEALDRSVELDPRRAESLYYLGTALRASGEMKRAVDRFQQATTVNPYYVWAWNGLGMTLASLGRDDDALRAFRRAVDIDPAAAMGYFNLAAQLERMGSTEASIESYQRFLDLSQDGEGTEEERDRARRAIERLSS